MWYLTWQRRIKIADHQTSPPDGETILDYPGGPNTTTRILRSERERRVRVREDVTTEAEFGVMGLLALKTDGGRHQPRNMGGL